MLKFFFLAAFLTSTAFAESSFSGTIEDTTKGPIDGANITVWDAGTGKGNHTTSSGGNFSLSGLADGDYLFKVEKASMLPVIGAIHVTSDESHKVNIVMLSADHKDKEATGAGSPLRDAVRPPSSDRLPRVRTPQVRKKVTPVYPASARKARVAGTVKIAMIILPDGTVNDLVVLSAPNSDFAVAALLAVRQWEYSPLYLGGEPVEVSLTVDIGFQQL